MAPLKILKREEWGALPPKNPLVPMKHPIWFVCFSYVECRDIIDIENVKKVQKLHMDVKGYDDIECSFVVGRDGTVYEGRGWYNQPEIRNEEAEGGNYIEIAYISWVLKSKNSDPALQAMLALLQYGVDNKYLSEHYVVMGDTDGGH